MRFKLIHVSISCQVFYINYLGVVNLKQLSSFSVWYVPYRRVWKWNSGGDSFQLDWRDGWQRKREGDFSLSSKECLSIDTQVSTSPMVTLVNLVILWSCNTEIERYEFYMYTSISSMSLSWWWWWYQFYKKYYHLKESTANYSIIGEVGIEPIEFYFYKAALRYWLRILCNKESTLVKQVYHQIYINLHRNETSYTWCWRIKKLLNKLNLEELWNNQDFIEKKEVFKIIDERLNSYFREEWIKSAKHSHTGLNYLEMCRFEHDTKTYLNLSVKFKDVITLLKMRTGNNDLAVTTGSYKRRLEYADRLCNTCK